MARTDRDYGGHRRFADSPDHDLKILQLTDTHLYADPGGTLLGLNTQDSFDSVMRYVRARRWPADMTLVTGDLVQDASSEGYERMWHQLAALGTPIHWLPGNHDDPAVMQATLERIGVPDPETVEMKGWRIVLLNSHVGDSDAGRLSGSELRGLEQALETAPHRHVLVCLHHPPSPVGSRWLDEIGLLNADELFAVRRPGADLPGRASRVPRACVRPGIWGSDPATRPPHHGVHRRAERHRVVHDTWWNEA